MARCILIVDESAMMRRVLAARIMSTLDDAVVLQASGVGGVKEIVERESVHLILYSWDIQDENGLQLCRRLAAGENGPAIPFLFLIGDKKEHIEMATELVGPSHLVMPCSAEALGRAIDRVCSPITLRQAKRYSIVDTSAVIEQKLVRSEAVVINISYGGALCELDLDPHLSFASPLSLSVTFEGPHEQLEINDIKGVISSINVMMRNPDQTPKRIRAGVKFLQVGPEAEKILAQVFEQEE